MKNPDDLIQKLFPHLDAATRDRITTDLPPRIEEEPELSKFALAAKPKHALRRNAEAFVLRTLVSQRFGDDSVVSPAISSIVEHGYAPRAAKAILDSTDIGELRAALESLATSSTPRATTISPEEAKMPDFQFDVRNLPDALKTQAAQDAYYAAVQALVHKRGQDPNDKVLVAAVVGGLLRQSQFNKDSSSLAVFVGRILDDLLLLHGTGDDAFNGLDVYRRVADVLASSATGNGLGGK
jgi:hypothetical protein